MSEGFKIPIYVRLRSCDPKFEFVVDDHKIISFEETERKQFCRYSFDRILDISDGQEVVYEIVAKNLVKDFITGHDVVIFAYGYTGSGKSYTIYGPEEDRGIVWRAINDIFDIIDKNINEIILGKEDSSRKNKQTMTLSISFTESYQKKQYDLLKNRKLIEKDNPISEIPIKSRDRALKLIKRGYDKRRVEETAMNHQSSRSHAILTLKFTQILNDEKIESRLYLADLAGSESSDRENDSLMKETININSSLHRLKEFLRSLADKTRTIKGWRDMKGYFPSDFIDTLRGQCKMAIILNCSTELSCKNNTKRTLEFGNEIKNIKKVSQIKVVKRDIYKLLASYYDQESKLWEQIFDNIKGYNMSTPIDFNILKRRAENANKLRRFNVVLPKLQSFLSSGTESPKSEELNSDQYYGDSERDTSISQDIDEISLLEYSDVSYSDPDEIENAYSSLDDISIITANGKNDINDSFKSIDDDNFKIDDETILIEKEKSLNSRETLLDDREASLNERETELDKKVCDLKDLEIKLAKKDQSLQEWEANLVEKEDELSNRIKELSDREEGLIKKEEDLNEIYSKKEIYLNDREELLKIKENNLVDQDKYLQELEFALKEKQTDFIKQKAILDEREKNLESIDSLLKQKEVIDKKVAELRDTELKIEDLKVILENKEISLKEWESNLEKKEKYLNNKEIELKQKEDQIQLRESKFIDEKNSHEKEIEAQLALLNENNLISKQLKEESEKLKLEKSQLDELKQALQSEGKKLIEERGKLESKMLELEMQFKNMPSIKKDSKSIEEMNRITKLQKNTKEKNLAHHKQFNQPQSKFSLRNIVVNLYFMLIFMFIGWCLFAIIHNSNPFIIKNDVTYRDYYDFDLPTRPSSDIKKDNKILLINNNEKIDQKNSESNTIDDHNSKLAVDYLFEDDKYYAVILNPEDKLEFSSINIGSDIDRLILTDKDNIFQFKEKIKNEFGYQSNNEEEIFFIIHKSKQLIEPFQKYEDFNNWINQLTHIESINADDGNKYWLIIKEWDTTTTIGVGGIVSIILFALGNFIARVLYV